MKPFRIVVAYRIRGQIVAWRAHHAYNGTARIGRTPSKALENLVNSLRLARVCRAIAKSERQIHRSET